MGINLQRNYESLRYPFERYVVSHTPRQDDPWWHDHFLNRKYSFFRCIHCGSPVSGWIGGAFHEERTVVLGKTTARTNFYDVGLAMYLRITMRAASPLRTSSTFFLVPGLAGSSTCLPTLIWTSLAQLRS